MVSLRKWERWLYGTLSLAGAIVLTVIYWKSGAALSLYNFFDNMVDQGGMLKALAIIVGFVCFLIGVGGTAALLSKRLKWVLVACLLIFIGSMPFLSMMAREATK